VSTISEISPANEQFITTAVAGGVYVSRQAAIDQAIGMLRQRQEAKERILARPVPLPELPPYLERRTDGYVKICGQRIGLHLILEALYQGENAEQIQDRFSGMSVPEVEQVLGFVAGHPDAMRAYLDQQQMLASLALDESNRGPTIEELRARWLAKFGKPFVSPCP